LVLLPIVKTSINASSIALIYSDLCFASFVLLLKQVIRSRLNFCIVIFVKDAAVSIVS